MPEITCVGILVADLLGRPIDALPPRGRLGLVDEMKLHIGGCASNTGIDLARLGVQVAVLGKVGDDGLGEFIVRTLEREGVDTSGVRRDPQASTSATMVLIGSDGERTFLHHLGGNARYTLDDVAWDIVGASRILHVAGALVMPALDGPPMAELLSKARSLGLITSLDTVWDATGSWMRTLGPCLPYADYFMPSLAEAVELTGRSSPQDAARALRDAGVKTVCLKMGEQGCYVLSQDAEFTQPVFKVTPVDGTGTGDAWDAGFLLGVLQGWDLERSARFANAVGAMCVTALGATAGVLSMEEVLKFMETTPTA